MYVCNPVFPSGFGYVYRRFAFPIHLTQQTTTGETSRKCLNTFQSLRTLWWTGKGCFAPQKAPAHEKVLNSWVLLHRFCICWQLPSEWICCSIHICFFICKILSLFLLSFFASSTNYILIYCLLMESSLTFN